LEKGEEVSSAESYADEESPYLDGWGFLFDLLTFFV
jgi:hypothetical protein